MFGSCCTLQRSLDSQLEPASVVPVLVEPASGGGDAQDAAAVDAAAVDAATAATTASDNAGCAGVVPALVEPASGGGDAEDTLTIGPASGGGDASQTAAEIAVAAPCTPPERRLATNAVSMACLLDDLDDIFGEEGTQAPFSASTEMSPTLRSLLEEWNDTSHVLEEY